MPDILIYKFQYTCTHDVPDMLLHVPVIW